MEINGVVNIDLENEDIRIIHNKNNGITDIQFLVGDKTGVVIDLNKKQLEQLKEELNK